MGSFSEVYLEWLRGFLIRIAVMRNEYIKSSSHIIWISRGAQQNRFNPLTLAIHTHYLTVCLYYVYVELQMALGSSQEEFYISKKIVFGSSIKFCYFNSTWDACAHFSISPPMLRLALPHSRVSKGDASAIG